MIFHGFQGSRTISSADVEATCSQVYCSQNLSKTVFKRSKVPGDISNRLGIDFLKFENFMFFKSKIMIFMIFDGFYGFRPVSSADVEAPGSQVYCTENLSKTVFQRSKVPGDTSNRLGIDFMKFENFIFFRVKNHDFHDFSWFSRLQTYLGGWIWEELRDSERRL